VGQGLAGCLLAETAKTLETAAHWAAGCLHYRVGFRLFISPYTNPDCRTVSECVRAMTLVCAPTADLRSKQIHLGEVNEGEDS
jgi:hypothetical protein